jgi:hypothetical protein
MIGVGSVTAPAADAASTSTRPDDRPGIRGPGALAAGPTTVLVASDGFDWGDAGVGLAGGVGVALVVGALLVAATHRRRVQSLA